ncbi:MAG: hypothetical protein ABJB47_17015 [Actinomycetota bacterium]
MASSPVKAAASPPLASSLRRETASARGVAGGTWAGTSPASGRAKPGGGAVLSGVALRGASWGVAGG